MSFLSKYHPDQLGEMSTAEARARAALVEVDKREADTAKNIRAIGKDPDEVPESVMSLDVTVLYAPGKRSERRQILLRHAIQYLFDVRLDDEAGQDRVIARIGARTKLMVDWKISVWENYLRPKTWMDELTENQQTRWADAKRRYDRTIEASNQRMAKAKAEYDKMVRDVQLVQATAREELKDVLRQFGLKDAPLLTEVPDKRGDDKLREELAQLGVNFRPPDDKYL